MKRVLVPLADGFEEIEAVTIIDVLRRAGLEVIVASLKEGAVLGSRRITILPETRLDQVDLSRVDLIALPGGGPGSQALRQDQRVLEALREFHIQEKPIGAICAAPTVLAAAGVLEGRRVTSHPSVREELAGCGATVVDNQRVVVDGHLITSQGPGTSIEFALALVSRLCGPDQAQELKQALLARV